ncbi:hypothetical protein FOWG_06646 [Fusarium oxysporum f. sp. lycopersici MN25]|nr:hypothetical protein FOWG_06646 [Fusarium oxysporum f. sp. lycopersici MN25]
MRYVLTQSSWLMHGSCHLTFSSGVLEKYDGNVLSKL